MFSRSSCPSLVCCCPAHAALHMLPCTCCPAHAALHMLPCTCCPAHAALHMLPHAIVHHGNRRVFGVIRRQFISPYTNFIQHAIMMQWQRCCSVEEIAIIRTAAEDFWDRTNGPALGGQNIRSEVRCPEVAERVPAIARITGDARILSVVEQLLGPRFIWGGSEGNCSAVTTFGWHADRKYWGPPEQNQDGSLAWPEACGLGNLQRDLSLCAFRQLKLSLYLDHLTQKTGCFKYIPGSHRSPLYEALGPQECATNRWGMYERDPFGIPAPKVHATLCH
eukprot:SAG31_NODE_549_length_14219_cov_5.808188_6_plen_278_part_00